MAFPVRRLLCAALSMGGLFASPLAVADTWGDLIVTSPTLPISTGYLCQGAGSIEVGCPTTAPYLTSAGLLGIGTATPTTAVEVSGTVSATTLSTDNLLAGGLTISGDSSMANISASANVSVTGNVSANKFIGDGSGLTGISSGSGDRITSGTTSMVAVSATGYVSLTQAGANTGWFDPTRGLVTLGVSATGPISGTGGYFSGNVGIGTASPANILHIVGSASGTNLPVLRVDSLTGSTGSSWLILGNSADNKDFAVGYWSNSNNPYLSFNYDSPEGTVSRSNILVLANNGNVGIGITSPSSQLSLGQSISGKKLLLYDDGAGNNRIGFGIAPNESRMFVNTGGALTFGHISTSDGSTYSEKVRIASSGNVGIGTINPQTALEVSGTISATNFVGNGSGLTGIATSGDHIVSGTDNIYVNGTTHTVSITTNGTVASYFNSSGQLVTPGISATTNNTSVTTLYASGNVGIGTTTPSATLDVSGSIKIAGDGAETCTDATVGMIRRNPVTGHLEACH